MRQPELTFHRVASAPELAVLVDAVFADPEARRGMGWTPEDDLDEAMDAIHGLWGYRLENDWRIWRIHQGEDLVGLAGLGPVDPEEKTAWSAVYLLERQQGIGSAATQRLVEIAKTQGAKALIAVTWAQNEAAQALLASMGFQQKGPAPYDWAKESELDWEEWVHPIRT